MAKPLTSTDKTVLGCSIAFFIVVIVIPSMLALFGPKTAISESTTFSFSERREVMARQWEANMRAQGLDVSAKSEYSTLVITFNFDMSLIEFDFLANMLQKDYRFNKNLDDAYFDRVILINVDGSSRSWEINQ